MSFLFILHYSYLQGREKTSLLGLLDQLLVDGDLLLVLMDKISIIDLGEIIVTLARGGIAAAECADSGVVDLSKTLADELDARALALEVQAADAIRLVHIPPSAKDINWTYSALKLSSMRSLLLCVKRVWARKLW